MDDLFRVKRVYDLSRYVGIIANKHSIFCSFQHSGFMNVQKNQIYNILCTLYDLKIRYVACCLTENF